eukprot:1155358-Pelagomonas_calceolata.AAC.6
MRRLFVEVEAGPQSFTPLVWGGGPLVTRRWVSGYKGSESLVTMEGGSGYKHVLVGLWLRRRGSLW